MSDQGIWTKIARPTSVYDKLTGHTPESIRKQLKAPFEEPVPLSHWCLKVVLATLKRDALHYFSSSDANSLLSTSLYIRLLEMCPDTTGSCPLLTLTKLPVESVIKEICKSTGVPLKVTLMDAPPALFVSYYMFGKVLFKCSFHQDELDAALEELHDSMYRWDRESFANIPFVFGLTCTATQFQLQLLREGDRVGFTCIDPVSDVYRWEDRRDLLFLIIAMVNMMKVILSISSKLNKRQHRNTRDPSADRSTAYKTKDPSADRGAAYKTKDPSADRGAAYRARDPSADRGAAYRARDPSADRSAAYKFRDPSADCSAAYRARDSSYDPCKMQQNNERGPEIGRRVRDSSLTRGYGRMERGRRFQDHSMETKNIEGDKSWIKTDEKPVEMEQETVIDPDKTYSDKTTPLAKGYPSNLSVRDIRGSSEDEPTVRVTPLQFRDNTLLGPPSMRTGSSADLMPSSWSARGHRNIYGESGSMQNSFDGSADDTSSVGNRNQPRSHAHNDRVMRIPSRVSARTRRRRNSSFTPLWDSSQMTASDRGREDMTSPIDRCSVPSSLLSFHAMDSAQGSLARTHIENPIHQSKDRDFSRRTGSGQRRRSSLPRQPKETAQKSKETAQKSKETAQKSKESPQESKESAQKSKESEEHKEVEQKKGHNKNSKRKGRGRDFSMERVRKIRDVSVDKMKRIWSKSPSRTSITSKENDSKKKMDQLTFY